MKMKVVVSFFVFAFLSVGLFAQHTNFNTQKNWSLNKKEFYFGAGATQFLGDLGGAPGVGKAYSLKDWNWPSVSWNALVGFRYRFHPNFATTTNLNVGVLKGDDALTKEPIRRARNLNFRTINVELTQRLEIIIFTNEKVGNRYKMRNHSKRFKNRNEMLYVFGGIGINYFNPKGKNANGDWVALRPLNTEGQTLEGGPKKYLPITAVIPVGVGFKFGLSKMWRMGIEATYVKTFSDYIDDVSTVYYDPVALGNSFGAESAAMANKSTANGFEAGEQRGDPGEKDAYFYISAYFSRNITYKNRKMNTKWRGRYKF